MTTLPALFEQFGRKLSSIGLTGVTEFKPFHPPQFYIDYLGKTEYYFLEQLLNFLILDSNNELILKEISKVNYLASLISAPIDLNSQKYVYLFVGRVAYFVDKSIGDFDGVNILSKNFDVIINFYLVNSQGDRINIIKRISPDTPVYSGTLVRNTGSATVSRSVGRLTAISEPVVIKMTLFSVGEFDRCEQSPEGSIWLELQKLGLDLPQFYTGFKFLNFEQGILVIEELQPLSIEDDPYEIGRQIIPQLRVVHQLGVHNDLKPENILKSKNEIKFYLIDYESMATCPFLYGYERTAFTPLFTSQTTGPTQVVTGKNDLLELGYTMNFLSMQPNEQMKRLEHIKTSILPIDLGSIDDITWLIRNFIDPKLKKYNERAWMIDDRHILSSDYDDLIDILLE